GKWSQVSPFPYCFSAGTGVPVGKSSILVFSGDDGNVSKKVERLNLAISEENELKRRNRLIKEKDEMLSSHAGFTKDVWCYDTVSDRWLQLNSLPFHGQVTTTALLWNNNIII